jgi:tetratricopeptide (TPR) repeat protein
MTFRYILVAGMCVWLGCRHQADAPPLPTATQTLFARWWDIEPAAQADSLAALPPALTDTFYQLALEHYFALADRGRIEAALQQYQQLRPGVLRVSAIGDFYRGAMQQWDAHYDSASVLYQRAITRFEEVHDTAFLLRTLYVQSSNFTVQGRFDEDIALKYKALELARHDQLASVGLRLGLGNAYTKKGDFQKAISLTTAEDLEWLAARKDTIGLTYGLLGLAYAYCGQMNFPKALPYAQQAVALRQQARRMQPAMVCEALYCCGKCLNGLGRWQEALDTLRKAERINAKFQTKQVETILYYSLGEALFHLKRYAEADEYLQKSVDLSFGRRQHSSTIVALELLSRSKEMQGKTVDALRLHKQYVTLRDTLLDVQKDQTTRDLSVRYETREKEWQIASLQQRNQLASQRNLWILGSLLSVLGGLWFWYGQQARRLKAEKELAEAHSGLLTQQLGLQAVELNAQKTRLQDYTEMLLERNQRLADSTTPPAQTDEAETRPPETDFSYELYNQVILTDSDWEKFRRYFSSVYPNFLYNIKNRFDNISEAELRLFMLAEMGLDTKEMATMLGISTESVRKARYRIRKKFNLTGNRLDWS